jgi:hypothetical protein
LKNVQGSVTNELVPAADVHGKKKCGFAFRGGDVKPHSVEVYKLYIEGGGPA